MEGDILSALVKGMSGFTKGRKSIAGYILNNSEKAAFMTANRLGMAAGVSESTVVRFAAELGYGSYPEMRRSLQESVRGSLTSLQRIEFSRELLSGDDLLASVLASDIEQIRVTMEEANREDFAAAAQFIVSAKNIYIFGVRSSFALANFMGFYFNLIFDNVRVASDGATSEAFEQIMRIARDDVFIAISFPRYSRRTVRAMHYARDMGARVVGITDSRASPVAKLADIALYARSDMVSFVDTLVAPLSLVNALIVAASARAGGDIQTKFERLERIWDEYEVYEKIEV